MLNCQSLKHRSTFYLRLFLLIFALSLLCGPAFAVETTFAVSLTRPTTHLVEVEMRVSGLTAGKPTDLTMPVWTPGSYMVREFSRHVQDFEAVGPDGKPLPWHKTRKNIWQVENGAATAFIAHYRVYANDLSVRTNEFNEKHAFLVPAATFFYVGGALNATATVKVNTPNNWKVATGLAPVANAPTTFQAPDVDTLYDCPLLVSAFTEVPFTVKGVLHRIIVDGAAPYNTERLRDGVQRVVEAEVATMGEIPYTNYTFLVLRAPKPSGGLEHKNSAALHIGPDALAGENYLGFFSLVSHEFFHLWNVKRIKPDALGPFDYNNENYTRLLWVAEGITDYYADIHLRRSGLLSETQARNFMAFPIRALETTPGRKRMSMEEASFDAWVKEYRPDENSINSQISYYTKGALLGMLLDLTIRGKTDGAKSLDDVMRTLYTDFAKKNKNYTPQDFQKVCEAAAGGSLESFFAKYVRGRDELDYDTPLAFVGLRLMRSPANSDPETYLGATLASDPAGVRLSEVLSDTPAIDQGLSVGDIIVAADDKRVASSDFLNARIAEKQPGDTIRLTLFRGDELRTIPVKLGGRPRPLFQLVPVESPTDAQTRLLHGWLRGPGDN